MKKPVKKSVAKSNGAASAVAEVGPDPSVALPEKYAFLRDAKAALDAMRPRITDLAVQIEVLRVQQAQAVKDFVELDQKIVASIRKAAEENGVQLDGQNWHFNVQSLTFHRQA